MNDDNDLGQPALSEFDNNLLETFNTALDSDIITTYDMYNKR